MARQTDWDDTLVSLDIPSGGQKSQALTVSTQADIHSSRGMTVVRTILELSLMSQSVAGAWGTQTVDLAIGIASLEAFAAEVLPDPNVQTEKPPRGWMWRHRTVLSQNGTGTPITVDISRDIHGMRVVQNGVVYLIVNTMPIDGTAFSSRVVGLIRLLVKLP